MRRHSQGAVEVSGIAYAHSSNIYSPDLLEGATRKVALTSSSAFQMQRLPELRSSTTLDQEPEVEVVLV